MIKKQNLEVKALPEFVKNFQKSVSVYRKNLICNYNE